MSALLLAALLQSACCTPNALIATQPVPITGQQTSMWCWAASGEMTMDFLGASVTQCDEANQRFGRNDCCNTPTPAACVVGGWPEYQKYGFTADVTSDTPLTWAQVKKEIDCRNRPFAFSWHWVPGGGGHMMVVSGYLQMNGQNYVVINDPSPWAVSGGGSQRISLYSAYVSGPGYTHWNDYYNIRRQ
ncbi:MAG TPA: C39 family peptidase [Thermoanaerobaculia bacterium]